MNILRRLSLAARAAILTFKYPALAPTEPPGLVAKDDWSAYETRLFRYVHYSLLYHNKVFTALERYRTQHLKERGLYRFTRPIYNPTFRLVELETAKAYGGALDWDDFSDGAIPLKNADDRIIEAVRQVFKWSNWGQRKSLYARNCSRYGDAVINVTTDFFSQKVRLELLHPGVLKEIDTGPTGFVKRAVIEYERQDSGDDKPWVYTLEIDEDHFATFRDGGPYAVHADPFGNLLPAWPNPYSFVPLVTAQSLDIGEQWGAVSFHASVEKIEEVNDLASILHDQIRKAVTAPWFLSGVTSLSQLKEDVATASTGEGDADEETERNSVPVIMAPAESRAQMLVADINIADSLRAIERLLEEIEDENPQLSLNRMRRQGGDLTYPGVMTAYDDAISRIQEFRSNVDGGLLRALQMAISIGAYHRFDGFRPFSLDSYRQGLLDFQIADRPIVRDTLSRRDQIELHARADAPAEWMWKLLGHTNEEIAQAKTQQEAATRQVAAQLISVMAGNEAGSANNAGT